MEAVKALEREGGKLVAALVPLMFEYTGRVRVRVFDPYGVLRMDRELEVEEGVPVQLRLLLPAGTSTVKVVATSPETGETLLEREAPVIVVPGAPQLAEWLGEEAQLVKGMEVVGGLAEPPIVGVSQLRLEERELDAVEKELKTLEDEILRRLEQLEKEARS